MRPWQWIAVALWIAIVAFHESAHDEVQAWAIARSAAWPWEIVRHMAYEGHGSLWPLLLWPFTLTGQIGWMHVVAGAAALVLAVVIASFVDRPFPPILGLAWASAPPPAVRPARARTGPNSPDPARATLATPLHLDRRGGGVEPIHVLASFDLIRSARAPMRAAR